TTGGASTGDTIPSTGTLAVSTSAVVACFAMLCGNGLSNANFAFSGGSWNTRATDNATNISVGTIIGDKVVSATTAVNAVLTWTSDSSIVCYQGALMVISDTAGGGGGQVPYQPNYFRAPMLAQVSDAQMMRWHARRMRIR